MRALTVLLVVTAALAAIPAAAQDQQQTFSFTMVLHENPLHIAPDTLVYEVGASLSILVGNPEGNNVTHNVAFPEFDAATPNLAPGRAAYLNFTLDQVGGDFEYYCTIPGHREGGMRGFLTVLEDDANAGDASNGLPAAGAVAAVAVGAAAALLRRGRA